MAKRGRALATNSPQQEGERAQEKAAATPLRHNAQYSPPAWAVVLLLAVVISAVYAPALKAPFIFDDNPAIEENKSIVSLWPLVGTADRPGPLNPRSDLPISARPLVNLSLALNYRFGGLAPIGYHAVNVTFHVAAAVLLWLIVRHTLLLPCFGKRFANSAGWLALVVAILWALHPLQTEAVAYVIQRTELMMAIFYLATLYCSLRYWEADSTLQTPDDVHRSRFIWLTLATMACLAGMASKQVMVSAPLIVLLFERTFVAGTSAQALRRSWPLYLGLASTWLLLVVTHWSTPYGRSAGFAVGPPVLVWWASQTKVLLLYVKLFIWPWPLQIHYQLPYLTSFGDAWLPAFVVVLGVGATVFLLWRNRPLGFLAASVFAVLAPTSVIPIPTEIAAERRMYLPLAAILIACVVGTYQLFQRFADSNGGAAASSRSTYKLAALSLPVVIVAIIYVTVSVKRAAEFNNEMALWQEALQHQPRNGVAHQNVAFYLEKRGDTPAAVEQLREAVRLQPDSSEAHHALGLMLLSKVGRFEEAASELRTVLELDPTFSDVPSNLAVALQLAGHNVEAIDLFRKVLNTEPSNWKIHNNLGMALQNVGRYEDSIMSFKETLRLNPRALDTYNDLANTYVLTNQPEKAIATVEQGLRSAREAGDTVRAEKFDCWLKANR